MTIKTIGLTYIEISSKCEITTTTTTHHGIKTNVNKNNIRKKTTLKLQHEFKTWKRKKILKQRQQNRKVVTAIEWHSNPQNHNKTSTTTTKTTQQ